GIWSAVITSVNNPGGEIRGQFVQRSNLADLDGDGSNDLALFRPSDGYWYWFNSAGFASTHCGLAGDKVVSDDYDGYGRNDIPVRGDFDGDGKSDLVVYRPSSGVWYILNSSNGGFQATRFGLDGDIPVAGNYDGDNKTDIAVFRPSDGVWYMLRSSDGGFQST